MTGVVVDTSAIVAILLEEPSALWLSEQLSASTGAVMSAPTAVELGIVLESRFPAAFGLGRRALRHARVSVIDFDEQLAERAMDAWRRFGKGRHPASLNLGDCFTYALAEQTGCPILCVGDDFARTDLPVLRAPGRADEDPAPGRM